MPLSIMPIPDALKNVLKGINEIRSGKEQVITVVGAGGWTGKKPNVRDGSGSCFTKRQSQSHFR
jgi:hypothetical protein